MAAHRVKKSGHKSGTFAEGDDPRRGKGPPKGSGGRPPNKFKQDCSDLTDTVILTKAQKYLRAKTPKDPAWRWCAQFVADYGKGKPTQHLDVTSRHEETIEELG